MKYLCFLLWATLILELVLQTHKLLLAQLGDLLALESLAER